MAESEFFAALLDRLEGDYVGATLIYALLAQGSDLAFVPISHRELADRLGGRVAHKTAYRGLRKLREQGLIDLQEHPNTTTRYRVVVDALRDLMAQPSQTAEVIPGMTPLPALARVGARFSLMKNEGGIHD